MAEDFIVDIFSGGLRLIILMSCVLILPGLGVGLIVSVFQAATQINEQTLSFFPRLIITFVVISIGGPWLLNLMRFYTIDLFQQMLYWLH
ncbi:MAG: flagellar biosynthetic protein FliQ [Gammaproteobacteria bacterium]